MPLYRIPATGEVVVTASGRGPLLDSLDSLDALSEELARRASPPRTARAPNRSSQRWHLTPQKFPPLTPLTLGRTPLSYVPLHATGDANVRPLRRRSMRGGSIRRIAFYTRGDPTMTPRWQQYSTELVMKQGPVLSADDQADAAAQLNELRDTDLSHVFFVGHGTDGYGPRINTPSFALHGEMEDAVFRSGDACERVNGSLGPLVCALAPHLSADEPVTIAFLACHCGKRNVLQTDFGRLVGGLAPWSQLRVEGYSGLYEVSLENALKAHEATDDRVWRSPDFSPPAYPPSTLVFELRVSRPVSEGDELAFLDVPSDDPLYGLDGV